jgi:outer membrane protein insertion porin family
MKSLRSFAAGLLVFTLLSVSVFPAHAADFSGLPITTIVLKDDQGRPWPNPGLLQPLLVVKQGAAFSRSDVRKSIEYLYLKGRFRDIRVEGFPEGNGVRLEYTLYPITIVRKVIIEGNHSLSSDRLKEVLGRIEGREFREEKLGELRQDVLALYHSEGFFEATVEFLPEKTEDPHQVVLRVVIAESEPTLIEEIRFTGNMVFMERDLLRVLKSEKGDRLRRDILLDADMEAVRKKYAAAGYPAAKTGPVDMSFRHRRAFITVHLDEGQKVVVRFTGNKEFSAGKLNEELLIWQERDISDAVIESSAEKIKSLYRDEGYADAAVEVKKTAAPGLLNLDFLIQEGTRVTVKEVRIEGNAAFPGKALKGEMELRESGWFRSLPFREDLLDKDVENIQDRYAEAGYLDAVVEKSVTRSADGREASVTLTIKEGKKTVVRNISFEGNTVFTAAQLLARLDLKPGSPFSERAMEDDKYRILSAYSNKGYLYARVEGEKKAGNGVVDIRFRITEDRPVTIGKIILRGNERTEDRVIMRELLVKEGDAYDYSAILKSQQQIYRLGFFGLARFEPLRPGEKEYVQDMLLSVEERPAGAVEFGVGYGNLDRFRGFAELSYSNLWGTAKSASLRFEGSNILEEAVFNFREPWFLGQRLEGRFRLAWSDAKRLNPDTREVYYQTRKTELSTGLEKVVNNLKLSLIYQLENVENYNVQPGAILSQEDLGRVLVSSVTPGFIWDLRDDPFNPRKGSLHGLAVKEAMKALGSEADFTKATFQTSWFLPVHRSTVLALSARAGRAWPHGETTEVPLHERFYLGGENTIRGYLQDSVGPQSVNVDGTITPTGGGRMILFNAELRIGRPEGFGIVLFSDVGSVWTVEPSIIKSLRASYGDGVWRASYGIGIRYQTPVGPLRLDYGQKINRKGTRYIPSAIAGEVVPVPGESPGELHINIGHAF